MVDRQRTRAHSDANDAVNERDEARDRHPEQPKPLDVEELADRVYRLMMADVRLERARLGRD